MTDTARPVLNVAARTDAGMHREVNEDALLAADPYFVVADGMGGHEAGDLASQTAIAVFQRAPREVTLNSIEATIESARRAVDEVAKVSTRGAGCTLTGVILVTHEDEPQWYVFNIGDSRVYLHHRSALTQLTNDHSLHAELVAQGSPSADEAPRNVITRALGSADPRHDAWMLPVQDGAQLLVCSDGLTNELEDEEIRAVLTMGGDVAAVADELVRRACEAGGHDNISVIVIDMVTGGSWTELSGGAQPFDASLVDTLDPNDTGDNDTVEVKRVNDDTIKSSRIRVG